MTKTTLVKNITSLSEARYCSGMMVDYISFDLNPESVDYITKAEFDEIKNWLSGVKILGNYETNDIFQIIEVLNSYNLDGFILSANQINMLDEIEVSEKFLEIKDETDFDDNLKINYIISNPKISNYNLWANCYSVLIGYDFGNVDIVEENFEGYAFKGSKELRPGVNNYDGLMEVLEKLEERD